MEKNYPKNCVVFNIYWMLLAFFYSRSTSYKIVNEMNEEQANLRQPPVLSLLTVRIDMVCNRKTQTRLFMHDVHVFVCVCVFVYAVVLPIVLYMNNRRHQKNGYVYFE